MKKRQITFTAIILFGIVCTTLVAFTSNSPQEVNTRYTENLTPDNAAFVMVDYLTGFDAGLRTIDKATFVNNATALAKLTEIFNMPTIVLGEEGGFKGNFYPLVGEHLSKGIRVERHTPSAWKEPKFQEEIKKIGKKKIIVGGISLDICTQLLTLDLLRNGYEVFVVVDASGSDQKLVEHAAMLRMTQAGATMISWASLASELIGDWKTPEGEAIGKLYQEHSAWGGFFQAYKE